MDELKQISEDEERLVQELLAEWGLDPEGNRLPRRPKPAANASTKKPRAAGLQSSDVSDYPEWPAGIDERVRYAPVRTAAKPERPQRPPVETPKRIQHEGAPQIGAYRSDDLELRRAHNLNRPETAADKAISRFIRRGEQSSGKAALGSYRTLKRTPTTTRPAAPQKRPGPARMPKEHKPTGPKPERHLIPSRYFAPGEIPKVLNKKPPTAPAAILGKLNAWLEEIR